MADEGGSCKVAHRTETELKSVRLSEDLIDQERFLGLRIRGRQLKKAGP